MDSSRSGTQISKNDGIKPVLRTFPELYALLSKISPRLAAAGVREQPRLSAARNLCHDILKSRRVLLRRYRRTFHIGCELGIGLQDSFDRLLRTHTEMFVGLVAQQLLHSWLVTDAELTLVEEKLHRILREGGAGQLRIDLFVPAAKLRLEWEVPPGLPPPPFAACRSLPRPVTRQKRACV